MGSLAPKPAAGRSTALRYPDVAGFAGVTGRGLRAIAGTFKRGAIVNIWASWCGSCKKELPMLASIQEAYQGHGLGLVLVTADEPEQLPKARALLEQAGLSGASFKGEAFYMAGPLSNFIKTVEPRWKGAVPTTLLIDHTGKVRYFWNGPVLDSEISPIVQGFLAGEKIDGMMDVEARP